MYVQCIYDTIGMHVSKIECVDMITWHNSNSVTHRKTTPQGSHVLPQDCIYTVILALMITPRVYTGFMYLSGALTKLKLY